MIEASLNEVEGLAAKAARGAGLSWGLAEEAGKAARWLAGVGFAWAPSLAALLDEHAALRPPMPLPPLLRADGDGLIDPLIAGSFLDDLARSGNAVALETVAHPVWLVPFAARGGCVVTWDGLVVTPHATGWTLAGDRSRLAAPRAERVTWRRAPATEHADATAAARSIIEERDWQALATHAARTYVPASEISRRRGAGAGLVDND